MSRRLTGDPVGITILRNHVTSIYNKAFPKTNSASTLEKTLEELYNHDYSQYAYPYDKLHAHTVAQYSLSTLIMFLVSHYLSLIIPRGNYVDIKPLICKKGFDSHAFGIPGTANANDDLSRFSNAININTTKSANVKLNLQQRGASWPPERTICQKCHSCQRMTENLWGDYSACLDCHVNNVCSKCGGKGIIIAGDDGLPKCYYHHKN
jgi:hypothetical protein